MCNRNRVTFVQTSVVSKFMFQSIKNVMYSHLHFFESGYVNKCSLMGLEFNVASFSKIDTSDDDIGAFF